MLTLAHMQIREPKKVQPASQPSAPTEVGSANAAAMDDQVPLYPAAASFVAARPSDSIPMADPSMSAAVQPSFPPSRLTQKRSHDAMTSRHPAPAAVASAAAASSAAMEDEVKAAEPDAVEADDEVRTPVAHARFSPPMQTQPEIVSFREKLRQYAERDKRDEGARSQSTQPLATAPRVDSRVPLTPRPGSVRPGHSRSSSGGGISRHSSSSSSSLGPRRTRMTVSQMLEAENAGPLLGHTDMRMDRAGKRKGRHEQRESEDEAPTAARQRLGPPSPLLSEPQQPLLQIPPSRRAQAAAPSFSGLDLPPSRSFHHDVSPPHSSHRDRSSFQMPDPLYRQHVHSIERETGVRTMATLGESSDARLRREGQVRHNNALRGVRYCCGLLHIAHCLARFALR